MTSAPATRVATAVRRRLARSVPGRGDRWVPLRGTASSEPGPDAVGLVLTGWPDADAGPIRAFVAAAANRARSAEGVLDLGGIRCDIHHDGSVASGRLLARSGRPLRGAGGLLELGRSARTRSGRGRVLEVDVPVAVLDPRPRSAENYFHLHVDALASRWLVERAVPDLGPVRWLVAQGPTAWQAEALALAGLDTEVVRLAGADRVVAPRFLVPVRGLGSRSVPDWVVTALRAVAGPPPDASGLGRLLHVARTDAPRRRVRGEEELASRLGPLGFTTVTLSGMPVAEQRARFSAADVIVAAHGAALTNLAWARAGAAVLELLPTVRPNLAYRRLAVQAGLRHVGLLCPPVAGVADAHGDMALDVDLALRLVDDLLAAG